MPSRTRLLVVLVALGIAPTTLAVEQRWSYEEKEDELSGKKYRLVVIASDDTKAAFNLFVEEGDRLARLQLVTKEVMFPDKTNVESKTMSIAATVRSTAMSKPATGNWNMKWMNYKFAYVNVSRKSAGFCFGGDSVVIQLDKTGKRFKFPTKGEDCEGFQEAVSKVLELLPDEAAVSAEAESK